MKFSDNNNHCMCLQNKELIPASESGDMMTIVSLLNSGADVQTENKVQYTLISLVTCSHLYTMGPFSPFNPRRACTARVTVVCLCVC